MRQRVRFVEFGSINPLTKHQIYHLAGSKEVDRERVPGLSFGFSLAQYCPMKRNE